MNTVNASGFPKTKSMQVSLWLQILFFLFFHSVNKDIALQANYKF